MAVYALCNPWQLICLQYQWRWRWPIWLLRGSPSLNHLLNTRIKIWGKFKNVSWNEIRSFLFFLDDDERAEEICLHSNPEITNGSDLLTKCIQSLSLSLFTHSGTHSHTHTHSHSKHTFTYTYKDKHTHAYTHARTWTHKCMLSLFHVHIHIYSYPTQGETTWFESELSYTKLCATRNSDHCFMGIFALIFVTDNNIKNWSTYYRLSLGI